MANAIRLMPILQEAIDHCWSQHGRTTIPQVIAYARRHYPQVFRQLARNLSDQATYRHAKRLLDRATAQPYGGQAQLDLPLAVLPGESPPLALAVDHHDGMPVQYVKFDCATWADMEAGLEQRELNIQRAVAKRDDFVLKMDALRQLMQMQPSMTVAEACAQLQKQQPLC